MAEPRDSEIRFNVSRRLAQLIDALVQSKGLQGRAELLTPIIEALVDKELHEATILLRMAGINPADPDAPRTQARIMRGDDAQASASGAVIERAQRAGGSS